MVGLYLDPPEKAIVFSVDEKSQIQALDRSQPGLPMKPGKCGTMTHDYKRHDEFLKFLKTIDRRTDKGLALHLIVDNYATHKLAKVKDWLARHPRFHLHFMPTSASWINLVERFFRDITEERIRLALRPLRQTLAAGGLLPAQGSNLAAVALCRIDRAIDGIFCRVWP